MPTRLSHCWKRCFQSMASPKSFALTMAHNIWVPSLLTSVYLGTYHTKPQVCITHNPMDSLRHASSPSNMHSKEQNTAVLTHRLPCLHSELHPLTPSFHLQQSYCTNADSEQPFQPRYATTTHQPYKSVSRLTHALKLLNHRLTNAAKHLHHCMLVNQLQHMTPSERFGFLLLWYASYHGTAIKYTPAMVPHTATCGDTFMNTVSKQSTLSQLAQLPHCRLWQDTTSQWHNLNCPQLHCACSPHPLHLQHWKPRWTRIQLFLPCQLFKRMPQHQYLWHPMPHLCSHEDLAMPAWHQDDWSRKSRNYWPRLSMDLVIVTCCHMHPR